jgi:hypothetical protein
MGGGNLDPPKPPPGAIPNAGDMPGRIGLFIA